MDITEFDNNNEYIVNDEEKEHLFHLESVVMALGLNLGSTVFSILEEDKIYLPIKQKNGLIKEDLFIAQKTLLMLVCHSKKKDVLEYPDWVLEFIKKISQPTVTSTPDDKQLNILVKKAMHFKLLEVLDNKPIFYILHVKEKEDMLIVKLGMTRHLKSRIREHKKNYGEGTFLLDAFEVNRCEKMERFMLQHDEILPHLTRLEGFEKGKEHILLGTGLSYTRLIEIVVQNINLFQSFTDDQQNADYEERKRHQEINRIEKETENKKVDLKFIEVLSSMGNNISSSQDILENIEKIRKREIIFHSEKSIEVDNDCSEETLMSSEPESTSLIYQIKNGYPSNTNGPRIQKLDPISFEVLGFYESLCEAARENLVLNVTTKTINDACLKHWIESGFRWNRVPRELNAQESQNVPPTAPRKKVNKGWVAKISPSRLKVLEVYRNALSASKENNISKGAISVALNTGKPSLKHFFELWSDVNPTLQDAYISTNGEIKFTGEYPIKCYSKETNALLGEFTDKQNAKLHLGISSKTVNDLLINIETSHKSYRLEWDHS